MLAVYAKGATANGGSWYYKISSDLGTTWGIETLLWTPTGGISALDVEVMQRANGTILVGGMTLGGSPNSLILFSGTTSGGAITWSGPNAFLASSVASIWSGGTNPGSGNVGDLWATAKIVELGNGTLIWPCYGVVSGQTWYSSGFIQSADGGITWGSAVQITGVTPTTSEIQIVRQGGGALVAVIRQDEGTTGFLLSTSNEGSLSSWSTPTFVLADTSVGRPAILLLPYNYMFLFTRCSTSPNSGWIYSPNAGAVWSTPMNAYAAAGAQYWYASSIYMSNGKIGSILSSGNSGGTISDIVFQNFTFG